MLFPRTIKVGLKRARDDASRKRQRGMNKKREHYRPEAPAMVLVTHHVEEIPDGFTHAMLLSEGEIVAQGLLDDVLTSENLSTAFRQRITLSRPGGRYFARRARRAGGHRRAAG